MKLMKKRIKKDALAANANGSTELEFEEPDEEEDVEISFENLVDLDESPFWTDEERETEEEISAPALLYERDEEEEEEVIDEYKSIHSEYTDEQKLDAFDEMIWDFKGDRHFTQEEMLGPVKLRELPLMEDVDSNAEEKYWYIKVPDEDMY